MRCFVALCPPAPTVARLDRWVDAISAQTPGARRVTAADFHLTLAFIGSLAAPQAQALAAALRNTDDAAFPPFTWTLDRVGRFDRARVLWLGGAPSPILDGYAQAVRSLLQRLNVRFDPRPFVAHLTVMRNVSASAGLPDVRDSVAWPLSRPKLMHSLATFGVRYLAVE